MDGRKKGNNNRAEKVNPNDGNRRVDDVVESHLGSRLLAPQNEWVLSTSAYAIPPVPVQSNTVFVQHRLSPSLSALCWVLVGIENALVDQIFWSWPVLQLLLQAVFAHVPSQLTLLLLQRWRSVGFWENVALNQLFPVWTFVESSFQAILHSLSLKIVCRLLDSWRGIGVAENVSVYEILRIWAVLEVFLQRVAAFHR